MKIREMDDHCGECKLIDWCGKPYEYPHLCYESRFKDADIETYIKYAETSKRSSKVAISNDVYKRMAKDGAING
jgi:hypothetical protein